MIRRFISVLLVLMSAICFCGCEDEEARERAENYERMKAKPITQQELESMGTYKHNDIYVLFKGGQIVFYNSNKKETKYEQVLYRYTFKLDGYVATAYIVKDGKATDTFKFNLFRCQGDEIWIMNEWKEGISNGTLKDKLTGTYHKYSSEQLYD